MDLFLSPFLIIFFYFYFCRDIKNWGACSLTSHSERAQLVINTYLLYIIRVVPAVEIDLKRYSLLGFYK